VDARLLRPGKQEPGRDLDSALKQLTDYTPEMPDEDILRGLLALNLERAQA